MKPLPTYLTKTDHAKRRIQEMILAGTFPPGARITSREISETLGISETPVREAIRALISESWLEAQNHVGAVVHDIQPGEIREISALRGHICGLAIELGAESFDEARLAAIDANITRATEALEGGDEPLYRELNNAFHALLCDTPQSRWCYKILENLLGLISPQRHRLHTSEARLREALEEHRNIYNHLLRKDYRAAADEVRLHEINTGRVLIAMLANRSA